MLADADARPGPGLDVQLAEVNESAMQMQCRFFPSAWQILALNFYPIFFDVQIRSLGVRASRDLNQSACECRVACESSHAGKRSSTPVISPMMCLRTATKLRR